MQAHSNINSANGPTQDAAANAKTQRARILRLLIEARGAWVPLPEIMACAAQYNARIFELRKKFNIENRTQTVDGARHSWFRLVASPAPRPAETRHSRASQFERQFRPGWQPRPFSEKRMAQDDCFVLTPPEPQP